MQKVEKLIQSGDIGPPADILSQNCQKRAIRPRNVHAHPSPDLIHLYKSTIFNRIFLSSAKSLIYKVRGGGHSLIAKHAQSPKASLLEL